MAATTVQTRSTTWLNLVVQADPDHTRDARYVTEYEFSSPGRYSGKDMVHEGGRRVFRGDYKTRGPYST